MSKAVIYGIPNCDTIKKSLSWLQTNGISFEFYDYKKQGISTSKLKSWTESVDWLQLINKKGTTWKKLDPAIQMKITTKAAALKLLQENTSMIKRPVTEVNGMVLIGYNDLVMALTNK